MPGVLIFNAERQERGEPEAFDGSREFPGPSGVRPESAECCNDHARTVLERRDFGLQSP